MSTAAILAFLGLRGPELIFVVILAILLFGGVSKISSLMRNLGKGVHSFKQGIEDAKEEMNKPVVKYQDKERNTAETTNGKAEAAENDHPVKDRY